LRQRRDLLIGRAYVRLRLWKERPRAVLDGIPQRDISRQDDHRDTAPRDCGLHRNLEDAGHLFGLRHHLTVVAALGEQMLRMGLLKVAASDLRAWNVRGDGEHRDATAVTVVEPVDQMEVPGAATSGADRQPAGEMRVRAGG